jgi:hypothetical protein
VGERSPWWLPWGRELVITEEGELSFDVGEINGMDVI